MKTYSDKISFGKNSRGVYSIDPILGCRGGMEKNPRGCFSDCYAFRIAKTYGYDFAKSVNRGFYDDVHKISIKKAIEKAGLPFIRMGTMGDPSDDWEHSISIAEEIYLDSQFELFEKQKKEIVIITRHWAKLTDRQLERASMIGICFNTSVSALDGADLCLEMIGEHQRIGRLCKSILRVITCDFNKSHPDGNDYANLQSFLLGHKNVIDTVFRPSKSNPLVKNGVIKTAMKKFVGNRQLASKHDKSIFLGKCDNCVELCGAGSMFRGQA